MKPKFNIGDYVEAVPSTLDYQGKYERVLVKGATKVRGVIVGAIIRYTGKVEMDSDDYGYNSYSYFVPKKGITLWQIREGYINKPKEALEEDIKLLWYVDDMMSIIPWKKSGLSQYNRERLSREMKDLYRTNPEYFPRDKKGRFTK